MNSIFVNKFNNKLENSNELLIDEFEVDVEEDEFVEFYDINE